MKLQVVITSSKQSVVGRCNLQQYLPPYIAASNVGTAIELERDTKAKRELYRPRAHLLRLGNALAMHPRFAVDNLIGYLTFNQYA